MSIIAARYVQKPIEVLAVEVTEENIEVIANWCDGGVYANRGDSETLHIECYAGESAFTAEVGHFVVLEDDEFFALTKEYFLERYALLDTINSGNIWLTSPFSG